MPIAGLSEHMLVALANITGLVDRLGRKGYVERKRNMKDRRLCNTELTEKDQRIHKTISQQFWNYYYVRHGFSSLTDDERVLVLGLLTRVWQSVEQILE